MIWYYIVLSDLLDLVVCLCCKLGKRFCSFIAALGWTPGVRTEPVYIHISHLWSDTEHIYIALYVVHIVYVYGCFLKNGGFTPNLHTPRCWSIFRRKFSPWEPLGNPPWGVPPGSRVQGLVCLWPLLLGMVGKVGTGVVAKTHEFFFKGQAAKHWVS